MNNRLVRNGFMYIVLAVGILVVLFVMFNPSPREQNVPISTLLADVQAAADRGARPQIRLSSTRVTATVDDRPIAGSISEASRSRSSSTSPATPPRSSAS